jgi:chromosome partitioning protein
MIIAVSGQKGGAGKSTTAVCLAMAAIDRGFTALLVDADPQGTARTWGDVATEAGRKAPSVISMGAQMHKPDQLPRLSGGFDWTIIDCPPRAGDVQRSALMVADLALLPCGPSAADAWGLAGSLELVAEAQIMRPSLLAFVLLTRVQGRTALAKGARAVLTETGFPVLRTELGYRVAFQECLAAGYGVTGYAPKDRSAQEVRALFEELEGMLGKPRKAHAETEDQCTQATAISR